MKAAIDALNAGRSQLGSEIYQAAGAPTGEPGPQGAGPDPGAGQPGGQKDKGDGPVEADYEVVE
jgi:hypothetical protein